MYNCIIVKINLTSKVWKNYSVRRSMKTNNTAGLGKPIPGLESQLAKITNRLKTDRKLGVILIDMTPHFDLNTYYNTGMYRTVTTAIENCICGLQGKEIRQDDVLVVNYTGGSKYYIFLSKAREKHYVEIDDYEHLCLRIYYTIYNILFPIMYPLKGMEPQVKIGYAFTFYNPFVEEMKFLQQLLDEAEITAGYVGMKMEMMKRKLLYNIIMDEAITTRYQPVITLEKKSIIGYEAFVRGPKDSFFDNAHSLFNFARIAGLEFELDWVCKRLIIKNARGLAADKKLFIKIVPCELYKHEAFAQQFKWILEQNHISLANIVFEVCGQTTAECLSFIRKLGGVYGDIRYALVLQDIIEAEELALLQEDDVTYLKLGMNITRCIESKPLAKEFLAKVIKAAGTANCIVIAEGIHTHTEMKALHGLGVGYGQGYFFAGPEAVFSEMVNIEDHIGNKELERNLLSHIYFKRGKSYFNEGDFDKAILEFTKVLEVDNKNIDAFYHRAFAFCEEGATVVALQDLQAILRINPAFSGEHFLRGAILEKKGDLGAALTAYERYMETMPQDPDFAADMASQRIQNIRRNMKKT